MVLTKLFLLNSDNEYISSSITAQILMIRHLKTSKFIVT